MKKQKQATMKPNELSDLVNNYRGKKNLSEKEEQIMVTGPQPISQLIDNHREKQVSAPKEANRGADGKYSIDKARAAQYWFKAAKEQHPDNGFLQVPVKEVNPESVTESFPNRSSNSKDSSMLYKGKKKEIVED